MVMVGQRLVGRGVVAALRVAGKDGTDRFRRGQLAPANVIERKSAYARLLSPRGGNKNSYARKRVVRSSDSRM